MKHLVFRTTVTGAAATAFLPQACNQARNRRKGQSNFHTNQSEPVIAANSQPTYFSSIIVLDI